MLKKKKIKTLFKKKKNWFGLARFGFVSSLPANGRTRGPAQGKPFPFKQKSPQNSSPFFFSFCKLTNIAKWCRFSPTCLSVCLFVCFIQTGFCRKGLFQPKQRHCISQALSWAGAAWKRPHLPANEEQRETRRQATLHLAAETPVSYKWPCIETQSHSSSLTTRAAGGGGGQRLREEGQQGNSWKTPWESSFPP